MYILNKNRAATTDSNTNTVNRLVNIFKDPNRVVSGQWSSYTSIFNEFPLVMVSKVITLTSLKEKKNRRSSIQLYQLNSSLINKIYWKDKEMQTANRAIADDLTICVNCEGYAATDSTHVSRCHTPTPRRSATWTGILIIMPNQIIRFHIIKYKCVD